ncbi:MAG: hypothetical protein Q9168_008305 [Polycauliona sp. 1 TL-2023]
MDNKNKSNHNKCSVCSKDADMACKSCKGAPDGGQGTTTVYYCGTACQKEHWPAHKIVCKAAKDRRILYRAGEICRRLFLTFEKNMYMHPIQRVEIGHGNIKWVDLGRSYSGELWRILLRDRKTGEEGFLIRFPSEEIPVLKLQEAILTHEACHTSLFLAEIILKDLMKGSSQISSVDQMIEVANWKKDMVIGVTEICVRIKNPRIMITRQHAVTQEKICPSARHELFLFTMSNGERFVMDLTAAQFGWYGSATMPWDTFVKERLDILLESSELGTANRTLLEQLQSIKGLEQHHHALEYMKQVFDLHCAYWQSSNISFKALVRCSEPDFIVNQGNLYNSMDKKLDELREIYNRLFTDGKYSLPLVSPQQDLIHSRS